MSVGTILRKIGSFALCFAFAATLVNGGTAKADVIDFSNTSGYGLSTDRVLIEDIRYDAVVANPFDPAHPTITSYYFDVPFRFDMATLHLIPDLGGATSLDPSTYCADLTVNVSNAFTGTALSGALVMIGSSSAFTNSSGIATFDNLSAGTAQIIGNAAGYLSAERVVSLSCGAMNSVGLALSPSSGAGAISANQVRVVLTWGANPSDLDSHLTGPTASSTGTADTVNRFHVYYSAKTTDVAKLDVDDTSSYGPETVTISPVSGFSTLRPGLYRYSVHHYSGSSTISNSNAVVTLQLGNSSTRTYTPPAGATATKDVWTVFELVVGANNSITLYDVNTFSNVPSAGNVRSTSTGMGAVETGVDFARMPSK